MIKAFHTMLKGALNFKGRTSRRYHNLAILAYLILYVLIHSATRYVIPSISYVDVVLLLFGLVFDVVFVLPMKVRRLHDCGSNAKIYVGCYISYVLSIILSTIILLLDMEEAVSFIFALGCVFSVIVIVYNLFAIFVASDTDGSKHGSYFGDDYGYFPDQPKVQDGARMFTAATIETNHTDSNDADE